MRRRAVMLAALLMAAGSHAAPSAAENARIERLIDDVESQATLRFVRNGYLIRLTDGKQIPAARFLGDEMKRMDEGK